jgi:hypothetical protein
MMILLYNFSLNEKPVKEFPNCGPSVVIAKRDADDRKG